LSDTGEKLEFNETVHQLFVDFKKAYDSVRREVVENILIEFGVPMKLVRLIKMCLNETYSKIHIGKNLIIFLFIMVSNKEMLYRHSFLTLLYNMALERSRKTRWALN
jgi:hypothetical protein